MKNETIPVTRPFMPPYEEFEPLLKEIWVSRRLTNNGKFHQLLEKALCEFLDVEYLSLCANGTIGLMLALHSLELKGEVITTPFTFPATTHVISWLGLKPVFVDIEPDLLNIDPDKIEDAITKDTCAILPVHVYGNPCDVERIGLISGKHNIPVVYDACHTFGVKYQNLSLLRFGHLSVLSFHPTKVFSTFEGGAVICKDENTKKRIDLLKNFGIANEDTVLLPGINGKMNELQAAFGLVQLKYIDELRIRRKLIFERYEEHLSGIRGIRLISEKHVTLSNYSYFPVLINTKDFGTGRDELYARLRSENILARKYFYPLLSQVPEYSKLPSASPNNLTVAAKCAGEILCLPIYAELGLDDVDRICGIIKVKT